MKTKIKMKLKSIEQQTVFTKKYPVAVVVAEVEVEVVASNPTVTVCSQSVLLVSYSAFV